MQDVIEHNAESVPRFWLSPYLRVRKVETGFWLHQTLFGRTIVLDWPEEKWTAFLDLLSGGADEAGLQDMLAGCGGRELQEELMRDGILE